jgi:ketosteroid isomerase-like protein
VSQENLKIVKNLLEAISEGKSGEALRNFYHADVIQTEYPNLLSRIIVHRSLNEILEASVRGKQAISKQSYKVIREYSVNDTVIIEVEWTGKLLIPIGKLGAGNELRAYFAQFIELDNGKILSQRTYDCFENFL